MSLLTLKLAMVASRWTKAS